MRPDEQAARLREQQRQADNARVAANARQAQVQREQEAARIASDRAARERFNEGQRASQEREKARQAAEEKARRDHTSYMKKLRAQGQQQSSEPYVSIPKPHSDPTSGYASGRTGQPIRAKKGGGFGKAVLVILAFVFVLGYLGSHSDKSSSSSGTAAPDASAPVPSPAPPPMRPDDAGTSSAARLSTASAPNDGAEQASIPAPDRASPDPVPYTAPERTPSNSPDTAVPQPAPTLQLMSRVQPVYPSLAKQAHIQGTIPVVIEVGPDGAVIDAHAEYGSPILVQAALEAARQWRYMPYAAIPGQAPLTTVLNFDFNLE